MCHLKTSGQKDCGRQCCDRQAVGSGHSGVVCIDTPSGIAWTPSFPWIEKNDYRRGRAFVDWLTAGKYFCIALFLQWSVGWVVTEWLCSPQTLLKEMEMSVLAFTKKKKKIVSWEGWPWFGFGHRDGSPPLNRSIHSGQKNSLSPAVCQLSVSNWLLEPKMVCSVKQEAVRDSPLESCIVTAVEQSLIEDV